MKKIVIKPVTRIQGHARVTIILDDSGNLKNTFFHVDELRGFEKILEGNFLDELPRISTRICGICPVAHHLASVKASESIIGVEVPEPAFLLRELMHVGQFLQSHALHFFFLNLPDFLFGKDASKRNITGIMTIKPEIAKRAIEIRKAGQNIIKVIGGKAIHPVTCVPGGLTKALSREKRSSLIKNLQNIKKLCTWATNIGKNILDLNRDLINTFCILPTSYMGTTKAGNLELYDGDLEILAKEGDKKYTLEPNEYLNVISESVEEFTYQKFPYLIKEGYPDGIYRVNSLARLNLCDRIPTPIANEFLLDLRRNFPRPAHNTLLYHYTRLIEMVYAAERALEILENDKIVSTNIRVTCKLKGGEGVGIVEAPRGTLIHHYKADKKGTVVSANIIPGTTHNGLAINKTVKLAVESVLKKGRINKLDLNKIEMAIRAYDPCLGCATHTVKIPLKVRIFKGERLVNEVKNFG
jgi:coenzyme F420-reducing hydrogenase alpha subunit